MLKRLLVWLIIKIKNFFRELYVAFLASPLLTSFLIFYSKRAVEGKTRLENEKLLSCFKKMEQENGVIKYLQKQIENDEKSLKIAISEKEKIQKEIEYFNQKLVEIESIINNMHETATIDLNRYKELSETFIRCKKQMHNHFDALSRINEYIMSLEIELNSKKVLLKKAIDAIMATQKEAAEKMAWAKIYQFPSKKISNKEKKNGQKDDEQDK